MARPEVVVAVDADDGPVADGARHAADQFGVLLGHGIADGVRQIHSAGAGGDNGQRDLLEVVRIGARGVLGRELHVVHVLAGESDSSAGLIQDLLPGLLELELEVNIAGCDKRVDPASFRRLQSAGSAFDIECAGSAQCGHLHPGQFRTDCSDRLVIAFGSDWKPGFQNVHAKFG